MVSAGSGTISLGKRHSLIVKPDTSVWAAGGNQFGQLGFDSQTKFKSYFVEVLAGGVKAVAAGSEHSMVLGDDGSVWGTGRNYHGQLGDGSTIDRDGFVEVMPSNAKAVAAGSKHSLVVKEDGSVWSTGCNAHGQLGDGTTSNRMVFVRVLLSGAEAVSAGVEHSMVLGRDGSVLVAGGNKFGQLGDGSITSRLTFVEVLSSGATAIAAGGYHSVILKKDGSVWAMGDNSYGQLGDGSVTARQMMHMSAVGSMESGGGSSVQAIAAGLFHSMVLRDDGSVWAVGSNHSGQLGDGSTESGDQHTVYIRVASKQVARAVAVAAGYFHSMILRYDGDIWGMGENNVGQLGDGSRAEKEKSARASQTSDHGARCILALAR